MRPNPTRRPGRLTVHPDADAMNDLEDTAMLVRPAGPAPQAAPPARTALDGVDPGADGEGPDLTLRTVDLPDARGSAGRLGKARNIPVEEAIIRRCRARQCSAEETLLEIYHAALSMRRAEAVARTLWGRRMSAASVCTFNRKIAARIENWRNRPIQGRHPYVFLGLVGLKCRAGGQSGECYVRVAVGVNAQGFREVLGVAESTTRDGAAWREFLRQLERRGLTGVRLFVSDRILELPTSIEAIYPLAAHQVCVRHLQRDLLSRVSAAQLVKVSGALDAIIASDSRASARCRALQLLSDLHEMKLPDGARLLAEVVEKIVTYYAFPRDHWKILRSNYPLMRILRQIRERARVVGPISDLDAAALMVSARLRSVATQWSGAAYRLDMGALPNPGVAAYRDSPLSGQAAG